MGHWNMRGTRVVGETVGGGAEVRLSKDICNGLASKVRVRGIREDVMVVDELYARTK